jgi:7,8-dihydropterin-6-yl-methyl-4-(beta-D-ribofuranosyl)aminobenzene 5'-phosphate synthase
MDLSRIEAVLLSHGHYDHAGGLKQVLEKAPQAKVYCHPHLFNRKFRREPGGRGFRENGLPHFTRETLAAACGGLFVSTDPVEVVPGFWMSGEVSHNHGPEMIRNFYSDEACMVPDRILDDQTLFIETPKGTVALLACSHSGLVNILYAAERVIGRSSVYAVVGGMHLSDEQPEAAEQVLKELMRRKVQVLGPAHCTGGRADSELQVNFAGEYLDVVVGSRFNLGVE